MSNIYVGADPEFFVKRGNTIVSAHDIVPGTKQRPYMLFGGNTVQADGTAVEFNVHPVEVPLRRVDLYQYGYIFSNRIRDILDDISFGYLERHSLSFAHTEVVEYDLEYFRSLPATATELGCEPDYNAYKNTMNVIHIPADKPTLRTAAGHIHIGWIPLPQYKNNIYDKAHVNNCRILVANLDNMLRFTQPERERDSIRRQLYGDYGAFRPKKYGVEWRTPSNFWIWNEANRRIMLNNVVQCVQYTLNHGLYRNIKQPNNFEQMMHFV